MKILSIAPQPFFSWRGTPFSVYYRTLVSCEMGHEVDVLAYGQGMDVEIPGCRIVRIPAFRWIGPVRTGPSLFKLFLDVFMVAWTVGLLLRRRYDVVHAHEEAVFWCRCLKPIFRFRLIYDMHSSLPQQLHNFQFTRSRFVHWLFESLEKSAVRAADAVITICPALLEYARTLTEDHGKILLIENSIFDPVKVLSGAQPSAAAPPGPAATLSRLESWLNERPHERIIAYAGTLETYQGIDRLIESFAVVARAMPEAGLLIIGGQPGQVEECQRIVDSLGISGQVFLTGQLPQPEAQRLVAMSGACVSPRFSGDNTPLKIYQLMASGVPMIATRIDSHTQVLNDEISTLTGVTTEELAEGMLRVLREPEVARAKAERARKWYEQHYARPVYLSKMQKLFRLVSPAEALRGGV
jgi:glycosyltransferase involved in cell wall biosynthesis